MSESCALAAGCSGLLIAVITCIHGCLDIILLSPPVHALIFIAQMVPLVGQIDQINHDIDHDLDHLQIDHDLDHLHHLQIDHDLDHLDHNLPL